MQKERREGKWHDSLNAVTGIGALWSHIKTRRLLGGAACLSFSLALAACGGNSGSDTTAATTPPTLEKTAALAASSSSVPLQMSLKMNTSGLSSEASNDRFIIKYKTGTTEGGSASAVQSRLDRLAGAFPAKARHLRRMSIGSDVVTTARKLNGKDARTFMRAIASDPNVEYIEADTEMSAAMVPNDPEYSKQWGLTSNQKPGTTTAGIRAEGAWDMANGAGSVIAVVDNGVTSHSDLNANILPGYDFTANNRGGNGTNPGITTEKCSVQWHGTHVAGIAAALTNNGNGIAGVAPAAKVVPVRVLNACGTGYTSDITDGIVWAAGGSVAGVPGNAYPAKVINVSLGGGGSCGTTFQNAIDYATSRSAVVVTAAGNNSFSATKFSPANCRNVISVGAINRPGLRYVESNFGPAVDLAAPGDSIWSTYNNGTAAPGTEGYGYSSGTSMAAPMVSGVVALIQSVAPTPLSPAEIRTLLTQNVQPFPSGKPDQPIGAGILDATAAVMAARSGKIPAAANFTCSQSDQLMHVSCTDLSTARGAPIRSWAWNFGTGGADTVSTQSVNPEIDLEQPGTYEITLAVTDSNGAVSRLTRRFDVAPVLVTDITDNDYGVRFPLQPSDKLYFSVTVPPGVRSLLVPVGMKSLAFNLLPAASGDVATLYAKRLTASMVDPDCTSVMSGGKTATCTFPGPVPAGTYYVMVSAAKPVDDVRIQSVATYYFP
ncbi:S8 family serine peptidase [Paraburkholderia sp.]|uniref:S8 family serine peptidase n=1 Tax=Paraburkholderia sp. TaxID=1926495 RepID=UPI002D435370|nr:S8 family serine peptidase [Paraburkholderia sp.]HZZ05789.1 S8 family serine peptidase [Paraburkholderia sp.]